MWAPSKGFRPTLLEPACLRGGDGHTPHHAHPVPHVATARAPLTNCKWCPCLAVVTPLPVQVEALVPRPRAGPTRFISSSIMPLLRVVLLAGAAITAQLAQLGRELGGAVVAMGN